MRTSFRELLAFHIEAQRGMFIDEAARAADGSGVWVFSEREADPTWNVFYVLNVDLARQHEVRITREFEARGREPVWYVADSVSVSLPAPWQRFSADHWMVREGTDPAPLQTGVSLRLVETAADAQAFNQLYFEAFWEGDSGPCAALPIASEAFGGGGWFSVRHWLAIEAGHPGALLSAVSHGGLCALYNVGTRPKSRGRGLATALMRLALAEEARRGAARFFLLTERDKPLEAFYKRFGFQTVATGGYYRKS